MAIFLAPLVSVAILGVKLAVVKVGLWTGYRAVEHGGDPTALIDQLKTDKASAGRIIGDYTTLIKALTKLQLSSDVSTTIKAIKAISVARTDLPKQTRQGLDNGPVQLSTRLNHYVARALTVSGSSLLETAKTERSADTALTQIYFGLFLIGRSGQQLRPERVLEVCNWLKSLHASNNKPEDQIMVTLLQQWPGVNVMAMATALNGIREAFSLYELAAPGMTPLYIGYALGGEVSFPSDVDLIDDVAGRFRLANTA